MRHTITDHVMTVNGPIAAQEMGLTLPHEHILVDFVGAEHAGTHRYDTSDVVATMRPYLDMARKAGVRTFVECTPMFLGRDVRILRTLADLTGLQIITNTGQYKEPFLPKQTFQLDAQSLAEQWIGEWEDGIEDDVRPGFIKTAVDPVPLPPVQEKIVRAAALTSRETGLVIATHSGKADQAFEILDILQETGVSPERWIFVHAQGEADCRKLREVAEHGAWIELDGIDENTTEQHIRALLGLLDAGHRDRILLSQDAGWYHVGEESGGQKRSYTRLISDFLPRIRQEGVDEDTIRLITVANPQAAFRVR